MPRRSAQPEQLRVTLRRRPNDFGRSGVVLPQVGCCCCCCCCCLHWIGALVGGAIGVSAAVHRQERMLTSAHWQARRSVTFWAGMGMIAEIVTIVLLFMGVSMVDARPSDWLLYPLWALAFAPSLAFLPIAAGALFGASIVRPQAVNDNPPETSPQTYAWRLAWRITWMSLVFSCLASGLGYLMMLLFAAVVS